ncbi:MAG: HEAT repeat domain-containing protein [Verrucomicrobia bacterium]|nr:HEAT repeat domain-containing protein [Verrucomicrobiota bacterium]
MSNIIISSSILIVLLSFWASSVQAVEQTFRAGAYVQDVTGSFDSYLVSGGFTERRRGKMNPGDLKARCFVLQRGEVSIAIAIVDSCMIPRTVCDQAKTLASKATGIPIDRILIAATHTHSAPSVMNYCLGTMADPAYTKFLPPKIAESIRQAHDKLEPARIGWTQVGAPGLTHCRRWITRPDRMQFDPFGNRTVRAMMHPGYQNQNYVGPSAPVDDQLSLISIQTSKGKPLAVLANFSMHYHGGTGPADYFGLFADRLAKRLESEGRIPVCAMSQGTSGDLHWMNYGKPNKGSNASRYADGLVQLAAQALEKIRYQDTPPLGMEQKIITLSRRLPDVERLAWADKLLADMKGRRPKNRPEVYAEQARFIHDNPTEKLVLQTLRIGDLGITTLPNEVYSITGLKLKARSPFPATFNIELANGAAGYIPPPAQHALGGYTTWPARTAGLEVGAEPKIVETLLSSLETLAGKPRRDPAATHAATHAAYVKAILAEKPLAYWRCEEFEGERLADASGNDLHGEIEGVVAYHMPGPENASFSGDSRNASLQLAGGTVSANLPDARSLSFWFWNGMSSSVRDNTGDLVAQGESFKLRIGGKADGGARGHLVLQVGEKEFKGTTELSLRTWRKVLLSWDGSSLYLFLDGNPEPEVQAELSDQPSGLWRLGGELPFEGRIDEVAWFKSSLSGKDAKRFHALSGITPPPKPPPPRPTMKRGSTDAYAKAVMQSKPLAFWRLRDSAKDSAPKAHHGKFEKGVGSKAPDQDGYSFKGGRMRAEIEGIGDVYSIEFWFRNSLPNNSRPVTAYLFSRGPDGLTSADGDQLGIGGTYAATGHLIVYHGNTSQKLLTGKTKVEPDSWHHVAMVRDGESIRVYLNGNPKPDIDGRLVRSYPKAHPQFFLGGRNDNFANLQGSLDEVALYDRALTPEEVSAHFKAVKLAPAPKKQASRASAPMTPENGLKAIHLPKGYKVQLVAAEPLVKDPVAIDWGPDGKLWVAEMADYPSGINGKAGGRIRFLEDSDTDGVYDKSTVFLEGVNFPAGIMSWQKGVLVAAAPDIFYAEDTTGDGKADKRTVLYTGFKQGNQQLRVNGLRWGLDNWVHAANGSHHSRYTAGIKIKSQAGRVFELGGFDFRIRPEVGLLEPLSGPSQFGRSRDDWGNWFGVQNSFPLWHYVLEHRYLSRNPDFAPPDPRRILTSSNPLVFPARPPQKRFHNFKQSGRFTSACSPTIYRDDHLFDDAGVHAFTCEPFHNLVQRVVLKRDGESFTAERAETEDELDFFASEDRWCRPVMARTGPDGALWVVDMYRYMIEHPEWLPAAGKAEMKPFERSGMEHGRIYRVYKEDKPPRGIPRLDKSSAQELVTHLEDSNGIIRDMAHRLLVQRKDVSVTKALVEMAQTHASAKARLHALCALDGLDRLSAPLLKTTFRDPHPEIRRHALRLAESRWGGEPDLLKASVHLADDPNAAVRLQAACSWGESKSAEAGRALAKVAIRDAGNPYILAAAFSSAGPHFDRLAQAALEHGVLIDEILKLGARRKTSLDALLAGLMKPGKDGYEPEQFRSLGGWLNHHPKVSPEMVKVMAKAREVVADGTAPSPLRVAAVGLLARQPESLGADKRRLADLLTPQVASEIKLAAVQTLARVGDDGLPDTLLKGWPGYLPRERSRVLDTLLQRKEWTRACLKAIEAGAVGRGDLDATRRQLLLKHADPSIRKTAARILNSGPRKTRREQIEAYRSALKLPADEKRGRAVFDKLCAVCHLPPKGQPMNGPDLRSITDRTKEGLFSSILDPNQTVDASYAGYFVTLADSAALYGRVLSETSNNLVLRLLDGNDRQLLRREIKTLRNSGLSLMPEGLEAGMNHQELADLIRFVQMFERDDK